MAILPAVYVTIEDQSFALPTIEAGRVAFTVLLTDRGIHNRVIQLNSPQELIIKYGRPDLDRTAQTHYLAEKFLQYSSRLYIVRPVLLDDPVEVDNASISNIYIKYNKITGSSQLFSNQAFKFLFNAGADADKVIVNPITYEMMEVGDLIYRTDDSSENAVKIIDKYVDSAGKYVIHLENAYDGTININGTSIYNNYQTYRLTFVKDSDEITCSNSKVYDYFDVGDKVGTSYENSEIIVEKIRTSTPAGYTYKLKLDNPFTGDSSPLTYDFVKVIFWEKEIYKYYPGPAEVANTAFKFVMGSNLVEAMDSTSFSSVRLKDWIYPSGDSANVDSSFMRQVVAKYVEDDIYYINLDSEYLGFTTDATEYPNGQPIRVYRPFEVLSGVNIRYPNQIMTTDSDNLWTFYAKGAGSYYNNIFLVGVRNIAYESLYTDETGLPLYRYAFMDLYIYERDESTGNNKLIEGPWTVSLIRTTQSGQVVRDINTGYELYLENIININSQYIQCASALGVDELVYNEDSEVLRLQVLSMFSIEQVYKENTLGENGLLLSKGEDGCLYDAYGRIQTHHPKIEASVARVFAVVAASEDQSIENLPNVLYPWYQLDYIFSGGFSAAVQASARELADRRNDCMLLADTGYQISADNDLAARRTSYAWNTWNAMLYVGYRQIFDINTGKYIWITPVYHAVERHLFCDAKYWISEPVAGIEKGAISEPIKLAYNAHLSKLEDMISVELNPTIIEPDGVYLLTQFTTWKRLSIMKRAHAVKFIHYIRKQIPPLLKDILQRKMTPYWVNLAFQRLNGFLQPFVSVTNGSERYASISKYDIKVIPDEARNELRVLLTIKPLRVIEAIHVNIIVV